MSESKGFTLIEIVMVLVILGILAAVAIPKYVDLQDEARAETAKTVAAEFQARLHAKFAEGLLEGKSCSLARTDAVAEANALNAELAELDMSFKMLPATTHDNSELVIYTNKPTKREAARMTIGVPACDSDALSAN